MSLLNRPLTYDDLLQMPDDGNRYELIDGELYVSPPSSPRHQRLAYRLVRLLGDQVDPNAIGEIYFAPLIVKLSDRRVVQPDLLFINRERLSIVTADGIEGPPDLVVEILSPSTRVTDEVLKGKLYADAGVPEYWLADPSEASLRIFVLIDGDYQEVPHEGGSVRSYALPGLMIDVAALFCDLDSSQDNTATDQG